MTQSLDLVAIRGSSANDVWAVGHFGAAIHWDGTQWTAHHARTIETLAVVGAGATGEVWTGGGWGQVWTWNGASWKSRVSYRCDADACGATGSFRSSSGGSVMTLPDAYWDGDRCLRSPLFATGTFGGVRPTSVWLSTSLFGDSLRRWDGSKWETLLKYRTFDWRGKDAVRAPLRALWGASDDDVWSVGDEGAIVRWNGVDARAADSPTRANLAAVWGSGARDVWAGGDAALLHWDGVRWNDATAAVTTADLTDVSGLDAGNLWATGVSGTILRRQGGSWSVQASGTSMNLMGVATAKDSDVWFVGERGTILHYDGATISPVVSPTSVDLYGVWARAADDVWAVGDEGCILHWDGGRWAQMPSPVKGGLRHVHGAVANVAFAVGQGQVIQWDGAKWSNVAVGRPAYGPFDWSTGVFVRAADDVWVTHDGAGKPSITGTVAVGTRRGPSPAATTASRARHPAVSWRLASTASLPNSARRSRWRWRSARDAG